MTMALPPHGDCAAAGGELRVRLVHRAWALLLSRELLYGCGGVRTVWTAARPGSRLPSSCAPPAAWPPPFVVRFPPP